MKWGPKEDSPVSPGWTGFSLTVPSVSVTLANDDVYKYKLPYSVPEAPCCTRISPMLYCCDVYCCRCCAGKKGELPFIDVVNQQDGHQVRYRAVKLCCRVPRVMTFVDGQHLGHLSRTMRCGNRCLTCLEDFQSKPVLQVGIHDDKGKQIARIDRNGRGKCCSCSCAAPMKCTGCCLTCLTCTCTVRPSLPAPCCGFLDCDPVCCDCCVKSEIEACALYDQPCCCIGLPLMCPAFWCCLPACETKRFKSTSTIMLKEFEVVDSHTQRPVGKLQAQYRGNYPSAYKHDPSLPFEVTGAAQDPTVGMLLSGIASGLVYTMGMALPAFSDVSAKPEGTSPDFTGLVETKWATQVRKLVGLLPEGGKALLRDDMVVQDSLVFGTTMSGTQVRGWRLIEFGYASGGVNICGNTFFGKIRSRRQVKTVKEVADLVTAALETQTGESGATFYMRFELPDQEKPVVKKGDNVAGNDALVDSKFNPPRGGFAQQMEEVALACNCVRLCRCPCDCTPDRVVCCRCPLYARVIDQEHVKVMSAWGEMAPVPVVMKTGQEGKSFASVMPIT